MMNKILTFFLFIGLIFIGIADAVAGSDLLVNVLTQSNSYLKDAGAVQQKYSGISRQYVTTKVGPGGILGPTAALAQENAAKQMEKVEVIQEQMDGLQARIQSATDFKNDMMNKYNELSSMAQEYKNMATDTYGAGLAIKEGYKNYATDLVDSTVNMGKDLKNMAENQINDVKNLKDDVADSATDLGNKDSDVSNASASGEEEYGVEETYSPDYFEGGVADAKENLLEEAQSKYNYNKADAIRSAAILADSVAVQTGNIDSAPVLPQVEELAPAVISASDIMANVSAGGEDGGEDAEVGEEIEGKEAEPHSNLNFEEQLLRSSNQAPVVDKLQRGVKGVSASDLITSKNKIGTRSKFKNKALPVKGKSEQQTDTKLLNNAKNMSKASATINSIEPKAQLLDKAVKEKVDEKM